MKILCEGCGAEISKEKAIVRKWLEENIYFCSAKCEAAHRELQEEAQSEEEEKEPESPE